MARSIPFWDLIGPAWASLLPLAALLFAPVVGADHRAAATRPAGTAPGDSHQHGGLRIGAYWWDGWFEGSPYIREPLISEYRDREPVWGWRDDNQAAVDQSIQYAARYGVDFFAFLWYPENDWKFKTGQPSGVLNNGLRFYLSSKVRERDRVGFLLMITQSPKAADWENSCRAWARNYLTHERYVRIDGRPALFFYELENLDQKLGGRAKVRPALMALRRVARDQGCPDPFLVLRARGDEGQHLEEYGFDGATDYALAYNQPGEHPYASLIAVGERQWHKYAGQRCNYIPSVTSGWDGRPRAWMEKEYYRHWYRRSPAEFEEYLSKGIAWARAHPNDVPKTPLLLIYAWNEVDEGGAICPTKSEGTKYLEALQAAVRKAE